MATVAAGPLVAVIIAGTISNMILDAIDDHYGLTNKMAEAIDSYGKELAKKHEEMQKSLGRVPHEIERGFIWRMYKWDVDNPRGY